MTKLTQIDRPACALLRAEAEKALREVAERYGVKVQLLRGSFDAGRFAVKVEFLALAPASDGATAQPVNFARDAQLLGLPADCYGKVVEMRGTQYRIEGLTLSRPRFPVNVKRLPDGKGFKFPLDATQRGLGVPVTRGLSAFSY